MSDWLAYEAANARARYTYRHHPFAASQQIAHGSILRQLQLGRIDAPTAWAMRREVERWGRPSSHRTNDRPGMPPEPASETTPDGRKPAA